MTEQQEKNMDDNILQSWKSMSSGLATACLLPMNPKSQNRPQFSQIHACLFCPSQQVRTLRVGEPCSLLPQGPVQEARRTACRPWTDRAVHGPGDEPVCGIWARPSCRGCRETRPSAGWGWPEVQTPRPPSPGLVTTVQRYYHVSG